MNIYRLSSDSNTISRADDNFCKQVNNDYKEIIDSMCRDFNMEIDEYPIPIVNIMNEVDLNLNFDNDLANETQELVNMNEDGQIAQLPDQNVLSDCSHPENSIEDFNKANTSKIIVYDQINQNLDSTKDNSNSMNCNNHHSELQNDFLIDVSVANFSNQIKNGVILSHQRSSDIYHKSKYANAMLSNGDCKRLEKNANPTIDGKNESEKLKTFDCWDQYWTYD